MKHLCLLVIFISLSCCSKKSEQATDRSSIASINSDEVDSDGGGDAEDEEVDYPDGRYCARVEYYYSETGTSSTYTLAITIEDGEVDRIHWPNGGWLDNSHFSSADISDGTAQFHSFEGVDYRVTVIGQDGECSLSTSAVDEDQLVEEAREAENRSMQELLDQQEQEVAREERRIQIEQQQEEEEETSRQAEEEQEEDPDQ